MIFVAPVEPGRELLLECCDIRDTPPSIQRRTQDSVIAQIRPPVGLSDGGRARGFVVIGIAHDPHPSARRTHGVISKIQRRGAIGFKR